MENASNPRNAAGTLNATSALAEPQLREAQALLETCNRAASIDIPIFVPELADPANVQTAITFTEHSALIGLAAVPDDSDVSELAVYDREGKACRRCGSTIERVLQAGRSTYYCPGCQH